MHPQPRALAVAGAPRIGCAPEKQPANPEAKDRRPDDERFEKMNDPPLTAKTHFPAGQLAESQGELDRAIAQYLEVLKLDPNHRDALFHLGQLYTQRKQYAQFFFIWQRHLQATKIIPVAYSYL